MTAPAPTITPELKALLRKVKLGQCLDTLPERVALAKSRSLGHAEFLELVLSDEVIRRDTHSADLRAKTAGLDASMRFEDWDDTAAVRRRYSVHFERADQLFKRLKVSRLDNSHDAEMRKLLRVDLLILDDFCLQPLDAADTADVYELIVERHRHAATVTTSNREPIEWLALMADALLAQSAIDRLQSSAYELILEGESYRSRQKPSPGDQTEPSQRRRRRA